ncbi:hypothetical protein ACLOJK_020979 [Asimina triloba]
MNSLDKSNEKMSSLEFQMTKPLSHMDFKFNSLEKYIQTEFQHVKALVSNNVLSNSTPTSTQAESSSSHNHLNIPPKPTSPHSTQPPTPTEILQSPSSLPLALTTMTPPTVSIAHVFSSILSSLTTPPLSTPTSVIPSTPPTSILSIKLIIPGTNKSRAKQYRGLNPPLHPSTTPISTRLSLPTPSPPTTSTSSLSITLGTLQANLQAHPFMGIFPGSSPGLFMAPMPVSFHLPTPSLPFPSTIFKLVTLEPIDPAPSIQPLALSHLLNLL